MYEKNTNFMAFIHERSNAQSTFKCFETIKFKTEMNNTKYCFHCLLKWFIKLCGKLSDLGSEKKL